MESVKERCWKSRSGAPDPDRRQPGEPAWMEELRRRGAALGPLAHLFPFAQLASVARRNERERRRVRQINSAFACLRSRVQHRSLKRKLSKVDTLRCAIEYIRHLKGVLGVPDRKGGAAAGGEAPPAAETSPPDGDGSWTSGSDLDLGWCDDVECDWTQSPG